MPALTTVVTHATGDVFPASDWNSYVRDDLNYLIQAGAALASAATINPTNEFHQVTGSVAIATITATAPVVGQRLRLWFAATCAINVTGNIATATGVIRTVHPNEIVEFAYDGAKWREARPAPGSLVGYAKGTASVSPSATTFATGALLLGGIISFSADGVSDYLFTLMAQGWSNSSAASNSIISADLDNGTEAGRMAFMGQAVAGEQTALAARALIVAPAAGVHTLNARCFVGGGVATVVGGAGGAGVPLPIVGTVEVAA